MSIMDFSGKHFLVIGAGISGRAASLALAGHGGSVTLNDMKAIDTAMSSSRRRSFLRKSRS